jgi:CRP-like cAMP-binding protein
MLTSLPPIQARNQILKTLPAEVFNRIYPHLDYATYSPGEILCEAGAQMEYVYFPTTSIIFWLYTVESGATVEISIVGNRGMLGTSLFLGGMAMPYCAVVQVAGGVLRMKADILYDEFDRGGALQRLLLRYTQAFITQISQISVCHRLHTIEQQLCRLLLLSHDNIESDELPMTQELIANLLGVSREGITHAARHLQSDGLINYIRGHIRILDRQGLEKRVCECYRVLDSELNRLLGHQSVRRCAPKMPGRWENQPGRGLHAKA